MGSDGGSIVHGCTRKRGVKRGRKLVADTPILRERRRLHVHVQVVFDAILYVAGGAGIRGVVRGGGRGEGGGV